MGQKVILGVHGLSNKPPSAVLEQWWAEAMREGLAVNRQVAIQALPFEMVYWADLMYPLPEDAPDRYLPAAPGGLRRYEDHWSALVLEQALDVVEDMVWALKQLTGMSALAERVLKLKLIDLSRYYTDPVIRQALRDRLVETLARHRGDRILLVAHSMGSIIAYDVLRQLGREATGVQIDHFVTIGSPLGLPHVKYQILREYPLMRTPSLVRQWSNFADRRDPVAVDVALHNDYAANDQGVRVTDALVLNDVAGLHHAAFGYLRTPEVTDVLRAFL